MPSSGYAPTYYPGTTSAADAQRVTVNLGEEVSGVTFGLTLVPLARVSGRVVGPAGVAPVGPIMAVPDDVVRVTGAATCARARSAPTARSRSPGWPPGRYLLQAGRGRRPTNDLVGRTTLVVAGANVDNVTIPLTTPGDRDRTRRDRHRRAAHLPRRRRCGCRRCSADPAPMAVRRRRRRAR